MRVRLRLEVVAAVALLASAPVEVRAADGAATGRIPDAAGLASLQERLGSRGSVRLVGTFGSREVSRPVCDPSGVRSAAWEESRRARPAMIVLGEAPARPVPAPIPWSEISEIQTGSVGPLKGAVIGTLTGIVVGGTLAARSTPGGYVGEGEAFRAIAIFGGSIFAGALVGSVVGSLTGWRTVYRAAPRER
jgi:hypothetical protein